MKSKAKLSAIIVSQRKDGNGDSGTIHSQNPKVKR